VAQDLVRSLVKEMAEADLVTVPQEHSRIHHAD